MGKRFWSYRCRQIPYPYYGFMNTTKTMVPECQLITSPKFLIIIRENIIEVNLRGQVMSVPQKGVNNENRK